jgi:co-chaperonin GroES (HSP10)
LGEKQVSTIGVFMKACGENVVLRKLEKEKELVRDGVIIPLKFTRGFNLGKAEVLSVGRDVPKEHGVEVGQKVMYDYYSVYNDNADIVITKSENIICEYLGEEDAVNA